MECTKDACSNHLCERCGCCSDCCDCEVPLDEHEIAHLHVESITVGQTSVEELSVPDEATVPEQAPAGTSDLTGLHSVLQDSGEESEEPFPASENNSGF